MTSDIVSVEIGRSTWQGPAKEAPWRADNRDADMAECAAFSAGYEAGERDGRASGQQVRALWPRWREMLLDESPIPGAAIKEMDEAFAALTPAPQAATPTEQEAVPVAWRYRYVDPVSGKPIWRYSNNLWNGQRPSESQPLYAHPPQPSEKVADTDAIAKAIAFSGEIKERRGWDDLLPETRKLYRDKATAALRALKGGAHG